MTAPWVNFVRSIDVDRIDDRAPLVVRALARVLGRRVIRRWSLMALYNGAWTLMDSRYLLNAYRVWEGVEQFEVALTHWDEARRRRRS